MVSRKKVMIRTSSLSQYPDCNRRVAANIFAEDIAEAGYVLRQEIRGVAAAIGTAVHTGAAAIMAEKVHLGFMPPRDFGLDAGKDKLAELVHEGVIYDEMSISRGEAETSALRMIRTYRDDLAPHLDAIMIEQQLEAEVTPTLTLTGTPDLVAREPKGIRDLKTGKQMGHHRPQIGGYHLLVRAQGLDVDHAAIDFIQRVGKKAEQPKPVSTSYDVAEVETAASNILRSMESDIRTFREGDLKRRISPGDPWAFLANPQSRLCAPAFCRAWGTQFCVEHRKEGK